MHRYLNQVTIDTKQISKLRSLLLAPTHPQEVILIVNKREDLSKTQQTPGSADETPKISTTSISPKPIRQRERSGVETDDDELLAQVQKLLDSNPTVGEEEEFLKEKIVEARLLVQRKVQIFFFFIWHLLLFF